MDKLPVISFDVQNYTLKVESDSNSLKLTAVHQISSSLYLWQVKDHLPANISSIADTISDFTQLFLDSCERGLVKIVDNGNIVVPYEILFKGKPIKRELILPTTQVSVNELQSLKKKLRMFEHLRERDRQEIQRIQEELALLRKMVDNFENQSKYFYFAPGVMKEWKISEEMNGLPVNQEVKMREGYISARPSQQQQLARSNNFLGGGGERLVFLTSVKSITTELEDIFSFTATITQKTGSFGMGLYYLSALNAKKQIVSLINKIANQKVSREYNQSASAEAGAEFVLTINKQKQLAILFKDGVSVDSAKFKYNPSEPIYPFIKFSVQGEIKI